MKELQIQIENLQNMLMQVATGGNGSISDEEYNDLRKPLLKNEAINALLPDFLKTNRSIGQFWEFIKHKFPTYAERRKYLWEEFSEVINYVEITQTEDYEIKTSDVFFENIQEQLKKELLSAKYLIWVAVAWFTNKELYDILHQKRKEGLSIQVLIIDDEINTNSKLNFGKDFYVQKISKKGGFQNIMHHKYCIIDLKTVVHGTYNWTNKANFNNETIDVENGRENAEKFADEFIKLKLENEKK